ncbi:MAG: cation diffusion facilitator family transporter [Treponema sp.]|nr:cation diffusion facilitator family transporter [Treponema sp.]
MLKTDKTTTEEKRVYLIRLAGFIALAGNLVLALIKFFLGKLSGSLAVTGDAIDTMTDVAIALMTIIVSRIISRPGDKEHPWGHGRAETTTTMVLSFIIFFAGSQLAVSSIHEIIDHTYKSEVSFYAILAALISICGKALLTVSQQVLGTKSGSTMIKANAQNMKGDIIMSAGVLTGIGAARIFKCPLLDPVTALLVGSWVVKNAVKIFAEMNMELMDGNPDEGVYKIMFDAVMSVKGVSNPHRARIRKIASHWDIDLDIEVDAGLTVHNAHEIANRVEKAVRQTIPDVYDIMVHVEPAGHSDHHDREQFGLKESDVDTPEEMIEEEIERSENNQNCRHRKHPAR